MFILFYKEKTVQIQNKTEIKNEPDNLKYEKGKLKAYPVSDPKLTVKILDLLQQAMNYKQVCKIFLNK